MDSKPINRLIAYIRKPQFVIAVVIIMGLLLDISVFSSKLLPKLAEKYKASQGASDVQKRKLALQNQPLPAKATASEIEQLVMQVPTKEELPRFILEIKNFESQTHVKIGSITYDGSASKSGDTTDILKMLAPTTTQASASGNSPATTTTQPTQPAAPNSPSGANQKPNQQANSIVEHQVEVVAYGSYSQGLEFIRQLEQAKRLTSVVKWKMEPDSLVVANEDGKGYSQRMKFTITCTIYTAKGYDGKFADLPPVDLPKVGDRVDPTLTDGQYLELLLKQSAAQ